MMPIGISTLLAALATGGCGPDPQQADPLDQGESFAAATADQNSVPGLQDKALVVRDPNSIPHILARTEHDAYFLQGWVHAQDRIFQMDLLRRTARGTLAELVGPAGLASDVELRTLGLLRAAERSWPLLSPAVQATIEAYSDGVNAYLERHDPPAQYQALEVSAIAPWSPMDTLAVMKALTLSLSFNSDVDQTIAFKTYQQVGAAAGFDGTALFFQDLYRSAPFDPEATVPDAMKKLTAQASADDASTTAPSQTVTASMALAQAYATRLERVPLVTQRSRAEVGSNTWVIGAEHSSTGRALFANDPHLALESPPMFHQSRLRVRGVLDVIGSGFAGAPGIMLGHNKDISWGMTINSVDVADFYQEQISPDANSPSGLSTVYQGQLEPIIPLPQQFRYNQPGDGTPDNLAVAPPNGNVGEVFIPGAVLIVPRRNQGPIVNLDLTKGEALTVQYTGFSGTREVEAFHLINRASNLDEFKKALQFYDTGSLNITYADHKKNIAYFAAGEVPLREDLQANTVSGAPPFFIRNGTGGNEWISQPDRPTHQALPYAIVPFEEMPQLVNPPAGVIINANNNPLDTLVDNDPLNQLRPGGGILYLDWYYRSSWRAARITQMIRQKLTSGTRKITPRDMPRMQSDTVLRDAQVFVPYIVQALKNAQAKEAHASLASLAADARVVEAVKRLGAWDFTTPTGIAEGYDASDVNGELAAPSKTEIRASVAASIYSVWRGQMLRNTIDAPLEARQVPPPDDRRAVVALRHLLDTFEQNQGVGASGIDFFQLPGIDDPAVRRDTLLLQSMANALDRMAGDDLAAAFAHSTSQVDYRWGRLHRIVFEHPLGDAFNIPPAGGAFPAPLPDLAGIPTDGGFATVDVAWHDARAADSDSFMFAWGAAHRYVAEFDRWGGIRAQSSLPGGQSGNITSPHHTDLLGHWLTNDTHRMSLGLLYLIQRGSTVEGFAPGS